MKKQREPADAADAYKKANKIAGGRCVECLEYMYKAEMHYREYKDAIASATALQALYTTPQMISFAAFERAEAMLAQAGDKPKPAQLEAADAALKEAIAAYPRNGGARFADGQVLARLGKNARSDRAVYRVRQVRLTHRPIAAARAALCRKPRAVVEQDGPCV